MSVAIHVITVQVLSCWLIGKLWSEWEFPAYGYWWLLLAIVSMYRCIAFQIYSQT